MQHYRVMTLERRDEAARTVEASLSSETPVHRPGLGNEILVHDLDAVDLSRCPLPLLTSHDSTTTPVGIIENVRIVGGKLRGVLRFGGSSRALDVWEDVKAGILRSISIGYRILDGKASGDSYRVTRWQPFEASLVAVPADPTVGIGRSMKNQIPGVPKMENIQVQESHDEPSRSQRRSASRANAETLDAMIEINAIAQQFEIPYNEVGEFCRRHGPNLDAFRNYTLAKMKDTGKIRLSDDSELGLSRREAERYSFRRAILAQVDPKYRSEAGLEMEVSRAVASKLGREPAGLFIPQELLTAQRSTMAVGNATGGEALRPIDHLASSFIDVLRENSIVLRAGATEMKGLSGDVAIPRKTGTTNPFWVGETEEITQSALTIGQVSMTPHTVAAHVKYTRRLLMQGAPDVEMLIRRDMAEEIAEAVDRAAIAGSGTDPEPRGILNTVGVSSVAIATDGGPLTWDHLLELEEKLYLGNAVDSSCAYLASHALRKKMKGTLKVSGDAGAGFLWDNGRQPGEGIVNGYLGLASNNVPSTLTKGTGTGLSGMIFGRWSDLLLGQWGGLDIVVDPYSYAQTQIIAITSALDVDIAVRRAASFAVIKDAKTS
ncbi:MAG TPA: phage major capsid protein [Xanthomonadaceae bacterium]|nr:phage major capsid protein [Xanthomonadaceae bacterium]